MKLSILPLFVACTGLLTSASPMRIVIVDGGAVTTTNGVKGANGFFREDGKIVLTNPPTHAIPVPPSVHIAQAMPKGGCRGARLRNKFGNFADRIKIAFGFSVTPHPHATEVKAFEWIGTPGPVAVPAFQSKAQADKMTLEAFQNHRLGGHRHRFHHLAHGEQPSFLMRVHFALMSLGPWEGRAVAFVLGCGIGVLLRMFWVMTILTYRLIKGPSSPALPSDDDEDVEYTVFDVSAEDLFVGPPTYTYPVEKESIPVPVVVPVPAPVVPAEEK